MQFHGHTTSGDRESPVDSDAISPIQPSDTAADANCAASAAKAPPSDFRHIFGAPDRAEISGAGHPLGQERRRRLLAKLSRRMAYPYPWPNGTAVHNPNIPAGYTYLAQFAAHDLVQSITPLPGAGDPPPFRRNLRSKRLILDTLYAGGPDDLPSAYALEETNGDGRLRLRLGRFKLKEDPNAPGPFRDVPRVPSCPFLNDAGPGDSLRTCLLPDPRNDDNFFVSQLTTLFHMLHNALVARIAAPAALNLTPAQSSLHRFDLARRVVAHVYRSIVRNDLLGKLLNEQVYERYRKQGPSFSYLDAEDDLRMPLEFSHGAYRFGHVMVRDDYEINDDLVLTTAEKGHLRISESLRATSLRSPGSFPLDTDWLIRWSRFFRVPGHREPQNGRRLAPSINSTLADSTGSSFGRIDGIGSGLLYHDLARGDAVGLRSVASIHRILDQRLSGEPFYADFKRLRDHRLSQREIGKWLTAEPPPFYASVQFEDDEIQAISSDPPLLLYVLLEAALLENGERLGVTGSIILAEVFFASLARTEPWIEGNGRVNEWVEKLFGDDVPATMGELVNHLSGLLDAIDPPPDFPLA